jgi:hypothetical protein
MKKIKKLKQLIKISPDWFLKVRPNGDMGFYFFRSFVLDIKRNKKVKNEMIYKPFPS